MSTLTPEGLSAGSKFGVYEIGACIGRGAMGHVYRAEHTLLKKQVALKVMATSARQNPVGHHRFVREARAAAAIKHPHVVDILDVGVLQGLPFIVMELLEGEDLESHLEHHGALSDQQLADLALPIIAAIGAVHDAGVVHRDIKPSNIFLSKGFEEDLVPKVLDFGISKPPRSLSNSESMATGPLAFMGTPLYMPPEALSGSQYLTPKSDQYSLGVVLYECATGRVPFDGNDIVQLMRDVAEGTILPLRRIKPSASRALEAAVSRATSRRPEDRFEHVADLGRALWGLASERTRYVWARRFSPTSASGRASTPGAALTSRPKGIMSRSSSALVSGAVTLGVASGAWWVYRSELSEAAPSSASAPIEDVVRAAVGTAALESRAPAPAREPTAEPSPAAGGLHPAPQPPRIGTLPPGRARPAKHTTAALSTEAPARRSPPRSASAASGALRVDAKTTSPPSALPATSAVEGSELEGLFTLERPTPPVRGETELDGIFPAAPRARARASESTHPPLAGANNSPILD